MLVSINSRDIWTKRRHRCPLLAKTAPPCISRLSIAPSGIVKRHHIKQVCKREERKKGVASRASCQDEQTPATPA